MGWAGFKFAIEELPLVFFTALAPMGIVCMIVLLALMLGRRFSHQECIALNQLAWIPLGVTTVGLIAAAAHLGTPANALFVVMGVGRSPLSNEVLLAVVFLGACGANWLYSFIRADKVALKKVAALLIIVVGVAALLSIAFAYNVDTIQSWHTVYVPVNLVLGALVGGLLLTQMVIIFGTGANEHANLKKLLPLTALVFLLLHILSIGLQWAQLWNMSGAYGTAADFAPLYPLMASLYAMFGVGGILLAANIHRFKRQRLASVAAVVLAACGHFVVRFGFYMMHMTLGLA